MLLTHLKENRKFELNSIFSDGLVLQRNKPIRIFGKGVSGTELTLTFSGKKYFKVIENGLFLFELPPLKEGGPYSFVVSDGHNEIEVKDILIGEVFLCAGQSNIEFPLKYEINKNKYLNFNDTKIRYFEVKKRVYIGEEDESFSKQNKWLNFEERNNREFSAIGFYFAIKLKKELNCPIGVISCSYGGTSALAFINHKLIKNNEVLQGYFNDYIENAHKLDIKNYLEKYQKVKELNKNPKAIELNEKIALGTISSEDAFKYFFSLPQDKKELLMLPVGPRTANRPGALYETMLKDIMPFSFSYILYYQGESDAKNYQDYKEMLKVLFKQYRDEFKDDNLPIYMMMLAPFSRWLSENGNNFPALREEQIKISEEIDNVYLTNIMDDGDELDIHPKNKLIVADRFFNIVMETYYLNSLYKGKCSKFDNANLIDSQTIKLTFKDTYGELHLSKTCNIELFVNKEKKDYQIEIVKDEIYLTANEDLTNKQIEIRYIRKGFEQASIFNKYNLPLFPFSIKFGK